LFYTESTCSRHAAAPENCTWDEISNACLPQGTEPLCERAHSKRYCVARKYCHWFHNKCHHIDKEQPDCSRINNEMKCHLHACVWENDICTIPEAREMPDRPEPIASGPKVVLEELRKPRDMPNCNGKKCEDAPTGCAEGEMLTKHT
jgi:hypothetical protein